jgi:hypothetical protein
MTKFCKYKKAIDENFIGNKIAQYQINKQQIIKI